MKRKPVCPHCGRPYPGAKAIEGRNCPKCDKFKVYAAFPSKYGMCDECKLAKTNRSKESRKDYFSKYYFEKIKPARQAKGFRARVLARINEQADIFRPLPKPIQDYTYRDERVD